MENIKQDMPPQGGYAPINFKRIPMKAGLSIPVKLLASCAITGVGIYLVHLTKSQRNIENIEMRCAKIAITPMLLAEVDRMYLKQVRRNRDEEEKIMKDVKDWEVGKYKGKPVYLSLDPNEFFPASSGEFYAHADDSERYYAFNIIKM